MTACMKRAGYMAGSGKHRKGHSMKTLHSLHVMERLEILDCRLEPNVGSACLYVLL